MLVIVHSASHEVRVVNDGMVTDLGCFRGACSSLDKNHKITENATMMFTVYSAYIVVFIDMNSPMGE